MIASPIRRELVDGYRRIRTPLGIYAECKALDQDPSPGTQIMFGARVMRYYDIHTRQMFYEPITSFQRLEEITLHNDALRQAGVPLHTLPWIQVGFRAFPSAKDAPGGVILMPQPGEPSSGHAVALTGSYREQMLGFINSWGAEWGDRGRGWLRREYLDQHLLDAWLVQDARFGLTAAKYDRMTSWGAGELAARWTIPNPRWTSDIRHNGLRHRILNFESLSRNDDLRVNVLEIRAGYGRLIAWAHLFVGQVGNSDQTGLLKEFFVWPRYRRQGYGTLLERAVVEVAHVFHCQRLMAWLYAWDRILPASGLAKRLGYSWSWADAPSIPKVQAILTRPL